MQRVLPVITALTLASLTAASWAASPGDEIGALRGECAAERMAKLDAAPKDANEYRFVYAQGQYKGEYQPGKTLACTDAQYAAFLGSADPSRVMSAYPTAAGRPAVKPVKK
jgi:hypothetical protein